MNNKETGKLIRSLRISKKLTQLQLAQILCVSDKTVSKWERGLGMPDVSLISKIADIFDTTAERILNGNTEKNKYNGANPNRLQFLYCNNCGNLVTTTARIEGSCCGNKMTILQKIKSDEIINDVEVVEYEYFVTINSTMTKTDFVTFVAVKSFDKYLVIRLYPEQNPQIRVPVVIKGEFFVAKNNGELYCCDLNKTFFEKFQKKG